jgi:hypothetical protein
MTTDLSKKQLATILSALDDAPRSPANKREALRAIGQSAQRFGLTTEEVLAAGPGLLDGRLTPAEFRAELQGSDTGPVPAAEASQGAAHAQDGRTAGAEPQPPTALAQPAHVPATAAPAADAAAAPPTKRKAKTKAANRAKPGKAGPTDKPPPRTPARSRPS